MASLRYGKSTPHCPMQSLKIDHMGTSLVVLWLRLHFHCRGMGSVPGRRTKIPHAMGQPTKEKRIQFVWFRDPVKNLVKCCVFSSHENTRVQQGSLSSPIVVDHRLNFFLAALGLHCCAQVSPGGGFSCGAQAPVPVDSVVTTRGRSRPTAQRSFPDQGFNRRPLQCKMDS